MTKQKEGVMFYQQGDVIIERVELIKGKKLGHLTLAEGEVTGHHHRVIEGDAELYEEKDVLYLSVKSDEAQVGHEEHDTITIPKGDYVVRGVREYDHFSEEARRVQD